MKEFRDLAISIAFILFGLFIGGVGLATAGIGITIPMIPIGLYFLVRWIRNWIYRKANSVDSVSFQGIKIYDQQGKEKIDPAIFEYTKFGQISLGLVFICVAIGASALSIGLPIVLIGLYLIYHGYRKI